MPTPKTYLNEIMEIIQDMKTEFNEEIESWNESQNEILK